MTNLIRAMLNNETVYLTFIAIGMTMFPLMMR